MLLKFITGLAWIWGSLVLVIFTLLATEAKPTTHRVGRRILLSGLPAWAWLLARYVL